MQATTYKHKDHGEAQMVYNLRTGEELWFTGKDSSPEYLVLYGYLSERGDEIEKLFDACIEGTLDELLLMYRGKFEVGRVSVTLGDWCTLLKE